MMQLKWGNGMLVLLLYLVNFCTIISIIFLRRKDISVTFAWLLLLIFLPVIGFLFYFFFGSTHKLEMLSKKFRPDKIEEAYSEMLAESCVGLFDENKPFLDPETEKYRDMVKINTYNGKALFTDDNYIELLVNGQAKFPRMFEDIKNAKRSINVEYFIIKAHDPIGRELIDLLAEKAAEGVAVKVLYDAMGDLKTHLKDFDPIVKNGGSVQRFLPSVIRTLAEVNYRLHRKMVVIDGVICYTGGINVGDDYLGNYPHITPWRDTSIRMTGGAVTCYQLLFFKDWIFCEKQNRYIKKPMHMQDIESMRDQYFPQPIKAGTMGVQVIECSPNSKYATHKDSYVKIATSAREYLYIQSPYFVPDQTLLDAIRMAAQSGVDVRLMIPGIPDKKYVYYVALSYLEELMEAGVKVYAHKGFIHAKTFVSDDHVSSIGTTNVDIRSFKLDYEVNTLIYNTEFAKICKDTFLEDVQDCAQFELEAFRKRAKWHYIIESLCRFIAPLS